MSPNEVRFETKDLSKVSFLNTDITRVVFDENARFGKLEFENKMFKELKKAVFYVLFQSRFLINIYDERFKIFDERRFEKCINKNETITKSNLEKQKLSLGSILASYRNLRENYEYRLRYDEAGKFFIREMEIKRKYREVFSISEERDIPKENNWLRRNFSFIGLYHNICSYGESSTFPLMYFGIILTLSTFYWYTSYSLGVIGQEINIKENCIEHPILCSLERTLSDIVGFPEKGIIIDYITRISSIIVLATLFLPFRRKFERRFRH